MPQRKMYRTDFIYTGTARGVTQLLLLASMRKTSPRRESCLRISGISLEIKAENEKAFRMKKTLKTINFKREL